jgi:hypothetical protein
VIRFISVLSATAIAVAAGGCGSDDSGESTAPAVSVPAVTSPLDTTTLTAPATTTTAAPPVEATTEGGKTFDPKLPDTATNDVPPPPGSPQEAFERQCERNPQACG